MKRIAVTIISITSIMFLVNWSSEETTVNGKKRQAVNFYGTLSTWNGEEYSVDNIAIGHLYKGIALYEPPASSQALEFVKELYEESNTKQPSRTGSDRYTLPTNPVDGIITKIDLVNVTKISIPNPDIVWTYQKDNRGSKHEFIEIVITSADNTKTPYLIDTRRKVTCSLVKCRDNKAVSEAEKEAPLKDIKELILDGHHDRDASKPDADLPCPKKQNKN